MEHGIFNVVDLLGTFAFAVSGAAAAQQRRLDLFGVLAIAYVTACGGGIVRDLCIGSLPPTGLSDWRYVAVSALAGAMTLWGRPWIARLEHPVVFFDSLGLGFFAVVGAHKALLLSHDVETAIVLGMVTGVGGGLARDVILNRVPVVLQKEIYAVAALVAAALQVAGQELDWQLAATPWFAAGICFVIRMLALRYSWSLPIARATGKAHHDRQLPHDERSEGDHHG